MRQLIPLHENILVKRDPAEDKTKGGIILPESTKKRNKANEGTVVAVPEDMIISVCLKVGTKVVFGPFAGTEIQIDESKAEYILLPYEDVLAIVKQ